LNAKFLPALTFVLIGFGFLPVRADSPAPAGLPTITFLHHSYAVYTLDPKKEEIRLYWKDSSGQLLHDFTALETQVKSEGRRLLFAANAGMFQPDFSPVGLLILNGEQVAPLNLQDGDGNFYLKPNGVFAVTDQREATIMDSSGYLGFLPHVLWATQSGPLLVHHGAIHPDLIAGSVNLNIRSGIGVRDDGTVIMALSLVPVNFYDFASFFLDRMKCPNALYLDGYISAFHVPGETEKPREHIFGPMFGVVTTP
jgi:uncharacterized protein YigE (DUF2233 family)